MVWSKKIVLSLVMVFLLPLSTHSANIRVGTVVFDPPYVLSLDQGFDIELMRLLCRRMNQQCDLVAMDYYAMFAELMDGHIDLAMDGIDFYIPPNPLNGGFIFSYPYLLSEGQFLVLKASGIKSIANIPAGSKVGLVQEREDVTQGIFYSFFTKKYGSQFKLALFDDLNEMIAALSDEQITAVFVDNNEANYWVLNGTGQFSALGKPIKVADGIGIMALATSTALINQINQQLKNIEGDKEYINLYNTYFGMDPK